MRATGGALRRRPGDGQVGTIWITGEPYEPDFGSGPYEAAGGGGESGCTFDSQEGCYEGGGGGGGSSGGSDGVSCDHGDDGCKQPLGNLNGIKVKLALKEIKDNPEVCRKAKNSLDLAMYLHNIYQGNPKMQEDVFHDAQTGMGQTEVHIDADLLDAINASDSLQIRDLAELLVHEGFHLNGCKHPGETSDPYSTWPFSMASACVQGTDATATTGTCRREGSKA